MISSIIGSIIIGFIVGALARLLLPGSDRMGCIMTTLVGIGGSILGGIIGNFIWRVSGNEEIFDPKRLGHFVLSLIGALLLLGVLRLLRGRER
jgi:uncharacterized membrane protein YeaQ/YmgE (transglycosylase-associated protein family)